MASRNHGGNFPLKLQEVIEELRNGQDSTNWLESLIGSTNEPNAQILVHEIKGCFSRALTVLDSSNQISNRLQLPPAIRFQSRNDSNSHTRVSCESPEDSYTWREFQVKEIQGFKYPRRDFVCIHKEELNCCAKKRVQRLEGDALMYEIIYHGEHTCLNSSFPNRDEMASSSSGFILPTTNLDAEHGTDIFKFDELMEMIRNKGSNSTNDD